MVMIYIHCSTLAIDASHQVSLKSVHRFRRRCLKGFYHIWAWQPSCSYDADYLFIHWLTHPIDASHNGSGELIIVVLIELRILACKSTMKHLLFLFHFFLLFF